MASLTSQEPHSPDWGQREIEHSGSAPRIINRDRTLGPPVPKKEMQRDKNLLQKKLDIIHAKDVANRLKKIAIKKQQLVLDHGVNYNMTPEELAQAKIKIEQMREEQKSEIHSDLQNMTEKKVIEELQKRFSGINFDLKKLLQYIEELKANNEITNETYNKFLSDYSTPCDKVSNMCTGITDTFKKAICCWKNKVDGGRKKKTRKKRKKKKVKNKRLLKTMRKRNKLRLNVQRKNCSIKKQKVKKNKYLKNKKKIMRLTRKLCKAKREVKKLMNKIGILKVKNNKVLN